MNVNIFFYAKNSPWPILLTLNSFNITSNLIFRWTNSTFDKLHLIIPLIITLITIIWTINNRNLNRNLGLLNFNSIYSLKWLILIFIISESFFFTTFFYINFSNKLFNNIQYNFKPTLHSFKLNVIISWLNLIILLTSRLTFIIAINELNKYSTKFIKIIISTITLRLYFISIQIFEYKFIQWNSTNSIYFSNFYLLTLFHIFHVILGTITITLFSFNKFNLINSNHQIIITCWYWHFIDIIWLIIVISIY